MDGVVAGLEEVHHHEAGESLCEALGEGARERDGAGGARLTRRTCLQRHAFGNGGTHDVDAIGRIAKW